MANEGKRVKSINLDARNLVIGLVGLVYLDADPAPSLEELLPLAEQALGIKFQLDKEGIYEEIFAYVAEVYGQYCALYREPENSPTSYAGKIVLHWRPETDPIWFGMTEFEYVDIEVSDYMTAILRKKTGLPFRAV